MVKEIGCHFWKKVIKICCGFYYFLCCVICPRGRCSHCVTQPCGESHLARMSRFLTPRDWKNKCLRSSYRVICYAAMDKEYSRSEVGPENCIFNTDSPRWCWWCSLDITFWDYRLTFIAYPDGETVWDVLSSLLKVTTRVEVLIFKHRKNDFIHIRATLLYYLHFSWWSPFPSVLKSVDWIVLSDDGCQWETLIWVFIEDYSWNGSPLGHKCSPKLELVVE